ncbi:MAG: hypothetical protein H0X34_00095 [Chthoniobacterales bacterium]|nr:hypothetical protein [Chthoniobacterales bacterium]
MTKLSKQLRPAGAAFIASRHHLRSKFAFGLTLIALSLGGIAQADARTRAIPIPTPSSQPISITSGRMAISGSRNKIAVESLESRPRE